MKNPRLLLCCTSVLGLTSAISNGALLSQWNFNAITTAPSSVASGTTAGNFSTTGSFSGTTGPISSATVAGVGSTAPYVFGANGLASSEAGAVTANQFYTFTLSPTVGNSISFSSLSFYGWANATFNADSYSFFVRTSQTGGTTLDTFTSTVELANTTAPGSSSQFLLDLSAVSALQNVSSTTTFTIGVYVTNPPTSGFVGNIRFDSIQLDGTVAAIPEPSAMLLGGLGLIGLLRRRSR